jgi:HD-GYP domain-containing protein (c-di-GMP phosphodiesterase class II)
MNVSPGLMDRLVALKQRLGDLAPGRKAGTESGPTWQEKLLQMEQQLVQIRKANGQVEQTGTLLEPPAPEYLPSPNHAAFSWRLRRLLLKGKEIIDQLRKLVPHFVRDENVYPPFAPGKLYEETLHVAEFALRISVPLPESLPEQDRLADGLQATLTVVEQNLHRLQHLAQRWETEAKQVEVLGDLLRSLIQERPILWIQFEQLAEELIAEYRDHAPPLRWFAVNPQRPERWAAAHGLNTAQVMARIYGPEQTEPWPLRQAVVAALVHDAGMAAMPAELLQQQAALNEAQKQQLETHVGLAADALAKAFPQEPWLPQAVRAHHERMDGTGYPTGAKALELPRLARWLALCDTYAGLCTPRPYRLARNARAAMTETLLEAEKGRLDVCLAENLLSLSLYPPGTVVELSDSSIGLVQNTSAGQNGQQVSCRPVVRLLIGAEGKALPESPALDLAQAEGRHIVRALTVEEARQVLGSRVLDLW